MPYSIRAAGQQPSFTDNLIYTQTKRVVMKNSICEKCSSRGYCKNRENGMMACINFNKFPKATGSYEEYLKKGEHNGKSDS